MMPMAAVTSLRLRLVLLALLAVIPALGLLFYSASEQRDQANDRARGEAQRLVSLAAAEHERVIEAAHQLLAVFARLPEVRGNDNEACSALLREFIDESPIYANLGVLALNGDVRCSALSVDEPLNLGERSYFQRAVDSGSFAVGDYQVGRITGISTVNVAYPILDADGEVNEVLFAALDLRGFPAFAPSGQLPPESVLTLIDQNGTVLVRYPEPEEWIGQSLRGTPVVETMLDHQRGVVVAPGEDDQTFLYAFAPLRPSSAATGVLISFAQPESVILTSANEAFNRHLGRLGLVGVLALVAAWVGGDLLARRDVESSKAVVRQLYDVFRVGNVDILDDILASDFVDRTPTPGQHAGVDGLRKIVLNFRTAFPDGQINIDHLLAEGDMVMAWVQLTGTHTGTFLGIPPSGESVSTTGIEIYRVANGRIRESWSMFDELRPITTDTRAQTHIDDTGASLTDDRVT